MKHLLLPLLTVLSIALSAQAEYSLIDGSVSWVQETFSSDGETPDTTYYNGYTIDRDTVINDTAYTISVLNGIYDWFIIREAGGRLYRRFNGVETVLMDFNLMVGDTFRSSQCSQFTSVSDCPLYMVVLGIDSVTVLDESERKRINLQIFNAGFTGEWSYEVAWIDGIGSTASLFDSWGCGSLNGGRSNSPVCLHRLVCAKNDATQLLYNNTEDEIYDCNRDGIISSNDTYQLPKGTFTSYPNPATNFISVAGNQHHPIARLLLTDMTGKNLMDQTLSSPTVAPHQIATGTLAPGVYNLTVFTPAGEWSSLRVVIR